MKVANIAVTVVLGSVEDERTFSTLKFMKSKLQNRLGGHLDTKKRFLIKKQYHIGVKPTLG
jgi:hypothetical protein